MMKVKRFIACIISCILFMVCIPFTAVADEQNYNVYPVYLSWRATSNTDGTNPITGKIPATVTISSDRNSVTVKTTEEFEVTFPIRITTSFDSICVSKYSMDFETSSLRTYKQGSGRSAQQYYALDTQTNTISIVSGIKYNVSTEFSAGSIIPNGFVVYNRSGGSGIKYYMRDTEDTIYGSEQDQYIKQLEAENATLRQENTELKNRINLLSTGVYGDVNGDEIVDVQDAQIILAYYTERDVAKKSVPDLVTFGLKFGKG